VLADALGYFPGSFGGAIGEHYEKFVSAESAYVIVLANRARHFSGRAAENIIAGQMAVGIVNFLKMVQIYEEDAERGLQTFRAA
jgi:hypothetical protein